MEAERLSLALLTALERLNPVERSVFLLREVFDYDYAEISPIVGRTVDATRQIGSRARARVGDPSRARPLDPTDQEVVAGFVDALARGDVDDLVSRLAADVVLWSDGGGQRKAARKPVHGSQRVATFLTNVTRRAAEEGGTARLVRANGNLALRLEMPDGLYGVMVLDIAEQRITAIRNVINPEKLRHVAHG